MTSTEGRQSASHSFVASISSSSTIGSSSTPSISFTRQLFGESSPAAPSSQGSCVDRRAMVQPLDSTEIIVDSSYAGQLLTALNNLRLVSQLTDVTLCVDQEEFRCHKVVLAASSPYFAAMFSSPYREQQDSRIVIDHTSPWTIKRILELVYTGRVEMSVSNVQDLLSAARLLVYPRLVEACVDFMLRRLDLTNSLAVEHLAYVYDLDDLKTAARKFTLDNFTKVAEESSEWLQLSLDDVEEYLRSDEVDVRSEETMFHACLRWASYNQEARWTYLLRLLGHVRVAHLPTSFINNQLHTNKLIQESPACSAMLKRELEERVIQAANQSSCESSRSPSHRLAHHPNSVDDDGDEQGSEEEDDSDAPHRPDSALRITSSGCPVPPPRPSTLKREMVVMVGGLNGFILTNVEAYHPEKKLWFNIAPLPVASTWFSAAIIDNDIYVTGGIREGRIETSMFRYHTDSNFWSPLAPMPSPRARHASVVVDGCLFLFGGIALADGPVLPGPREDEGRENEEPGRNGALLKLVRDIDRYNPRTDQWASGVGRTQQPRKESVVVLVNEAGNGGRLLGERTVVEVGGCSVPNDQTTGFSQMAIHRVHRDLTVQATLDYIKLPNPIRHAKCVTRQNGNLLYILCEESGSLSVLNLSKNSLHSLSPLPQPRLHCGFTSCLDQLYVMGGFRGSSASTPPCKTVHIYDPVKDEWNQLNTSPSIPRALFACLSIKM